MDDTAIKIQDAVVSYREDVALRGVSLEVRKGEFIGIIGPNGAGKTTLLTLINGLGRLVRGEVRVLGSRLNGSDVVLLDVREPFETSICNIPDSTLVPMAELPHRSTELDRDRYQVVYCRSGHRSLHAVLFLRRQGFRRAVNLKGGILEWIHKVDPSQTKY